MMTLMFFILYEFILLKFCWKVCHFIQHCLNSNVKRGIEKKGTKGDRERKKRMMNNNLPPFVLSFLFCFFLFFIGGIEKRKIWNHRDFSSLLYIKYLLYICLPHSLSFSFPSRYVDFVFFSEKLHFGLLKSHKEM